MPSQLTQDSLIQALVQLRKAYPDLPAVRWEIGDFPDLEGLRGRAFGENAADVLLAYAEALGGEITPQRVFDCRDRRMQSLSLDTMFADVRVEIRGAVPAPVLTGLHLVAAA